MIFLDGDTGWE